MKKETDKSLAERKLLDACMDWALLTQRHGENVRGSLLVITRMEFQELLNLRKRYQTRRINGSNTLALAGGSALSKAIRDILKMQPLELDGTIPEEDDRYLIGTQPKLSNP